MAGSVTKAKGVKPVKPASVSNKGSTSVYPKGIGSGASNLGYDDHAVGAARTRSAAPPRKGANPGVTPIRRTGTKQQSTAMNGYPGSGHPSHPSGGMAGNHSVPGME